MNSSDMYYISIYWFVCLRDAQYVILYMLYMYTTIQNFGVSNKKYLFMKLLVIHKC